MVVCHQAAHHGHGQGPAVGFLSLPALPGQSVVQHTQPYPHLLLAAFSSQLHTIPPPVTCFIVLCTPLTPPLFSPALSLPPCHCQAQEGSRLEEVMSRQIICVTEGIELEQLSNTFKKVSGVCVVDDEKRLIGVVSRKDLDREGVSSATRVS